MPRIENTLSQSFSPETQPEPLDASGIGFLGTATIPTENWWYKNTIKPAAEPLPPVQPVAIDTQTTATTSTQTTTTSYVPSTKGLAEYISGLWSMLWTSRDASKPINAPSLAPEQIDEKTVKLFRDSFAEKLKKIQDIDEVYQQLLKIDPAQAESMIYKVFILLLKDKLEVNEEKKLLTIRRSTDSQKRVNEANKELFKISEEKEQLSKNESRAKTATLFIGAAAGLAAFVTLAIGTGGSMLAAASMGFINVSSTTTGIAATASMGLNVASAASLVLKEYFTGKVNNATKESIILQLHKDLESEGISVEYKKVKTAMEDFANDWSLMREIAENYNQTSKYMIRR